MVKCKVVKVMGRIFYDFEKCSVEYLLWIGILNEFDDVVEKFLFIIEGYFEGYSDLFYDSGYFGYLFDWIIFSGEGVMVCWILFR